MSWPPRADDVYKCLYEILTQCTQCEYIPIGVPAGSTLPVGICSPDVIPVGICSSITLPTGICTVVSGGVEVTAPLPLPVGLCSSVEVPVAVQGTPGVSVANEVLVEISDVADGIQIPVGVCGTPGVSVTNEVLVEISDVVDGVEVPVGICSSVEIPVAIQGTPGISVANEVLVEIADVSDGVQVPVAICASDQVPVAICESTLINRATVPSMYNVGMSEADVEYSQVMPASTKKFLMHTEDGTEFRVAFETGRVAGLSPPFFTVPVNSSYNEDFIEPAALSLYFAGTCPGLTMEIVAWA